MPNFIPTGGQSNMGGTLTDTSTAGSLTGTGSDLYTSSGVDPSGLPSTSTAVDTTDPSSGGSDAGNLSSLLSSLGTSGLGNLALAGGAYGLISGQASAAQGQNNALAGQISAIGQPALTAGQGLLNNFESGTLAAPYAAQYGNAVTQNQQAATSEEQQAGQLLANAGGGNVQGAQASEYQQITQQQAQNNALAMNTSFMNELQASLNLTQAGGGFVQSGIQQEISSNTQLQQQLSQLMSSLANAYVKSQGSGGGGNNSVSNLISGGKNAYSTASKLMNGSTTAADNAAASADAAEAASSQASVFAGSGIGDVSAASDTTSALADLSSSGADANLVGDISSFSSGADAAGAASTTAAAGADTSAAAAGADVGASAGADAGAISAFGDVSAYAAPLAIAFGAYEQNLSEQIPSIDKTILSDTGQAQANIPAQYYQQAIMRGESPFQAWQAADPTAANANIQSLMAALQSPQNQQAAAQYGVSLPENFTGVNGVPNQLMEIYGGGPGGGSVVGDAQYHLT